MSLDFEGESFYRFALYLFMEAGHIFTSTPEYWIGYTKSDRKNKVMVE